MKEYYKIIPVNLKEIEIIEALKKVTYFDLNSRYFNYLRLADIQEGEYEIEEVTGVMFKRKKIKKFKTLEQVPIICEDTLETGKDGKSQHYLIDVVTGKKFYGVMANDDITTPSERLIVRKGDKVPIEKVASFLKSLTEADLARYKAAINEIDECMRIGYQNYLARVAKEEKQHQNALEYVEAYTRKRTKKEGE